MTFTTLLIDDEKLAIRRLRRLLEPYPEVFDIVGEAENGPEGLLAIESIHPQLVFLDIEMPGMNGFEMLSRLSYMPLVVFATAYDAYAVRAFEENSIDYLLKPIESERLALTVQKLKKEKEGSGIHNQYLLRLIEQMQPRKEVSTVSVRSGERILLIRMEEISYFESEDKYTFLVTTEGKKYLTDYTLSGLEEKLPAYFVRISRSVILNSRLLKEIQKHFSGKYHLLLDDKSQSRLESGSKYANNIRALMQI
jgi:two-component system LytT family response regulator